MNTKPSICLHPGCSRSFGSESDYVRHIKANYVRSEECQHATLMNSGSFLRSCLLTCGSDRHVRLPEASYSGKEEKKMIQDRKEIEHGLLRPRPRSLHMAIRDTQCQVLRRGQNICSVRQELGIMMRYSLGGIVSRHILLRYRSAKTELILRLREVDCLYRTSANAPRVSNAPQVIERYTCLLYPSSFESF